MRIADHARRAGAAGRSAIRGQTAASSRSSSRRWRSIRPPAAAPPRSRRHARAGGSARTTCREAGRCRASTIDAGRPRRPAVHRRHDRHAEGRDADAREHLRERRPDRELDQSGVRPRRGDERYLVVIPYFHIYAFTVVHDDRAAGSARCRSSIPKYDAGAGARRDPRLPADLLPRRADRLRLAARTIRGRASSASSRCALSTAAARRARSK